MANEKRLIDANDFLDLFYVASAGQDKAFIKAVEMVVEDTPTVDAVEVVHGRWERYIDEDEDVHYYTCSVCNYMAIPRYKYCPNCGAKMDGDGNENL